MTTGDKDVEPPSGPQAGESKAAATLGSRSEAGAGALPIPVPGAGATPLLDRDTNLDHAWCQQQPVLISSVREAPRIVPRMSDHVARRFTQDTA